MAVTAPTWKKLNLTIPASPIAPNAPAPAVVTPATAKPAPIAPIANAATGGTSSPTGFGGATYGTSSDANKAIAANQSKLSSDPNFVQSEINRTLGVINNRSAQGMDTTAENKYLSQNLGYTAPPAWATAQETTGFNNQIAGLQGQQEAARQAAQFGINTNNAYLQEQLQGLAHQQAVDSDAAQQLQNRRGGFYSGGLDHQLGSIGSAYATQRGTLSRDVASRNQQLLDQYGTQANSIATQISNLQQSQPDIIRQRLQDYVNNQFNQNLQTEQQALATQNQTFNQGVTEAGLTGMYGGQQTLEGQQVASGLVTDQQQRDLASRTGALQEWQTTGYATPAVSDILGVAVGTPTNDASYRQAAQTLDNDKFTYQQLQDVAAARNSTTAQTINASTAGDLLSGALRKQVGTNANDQPVYGTITNPATREQAFVDLYNNYGISGNDMVSALSKAGYTMTEIDALKQEYPTVFQQPA